MISIIVVRRATFENQSKTLGDSTVDLENVASDRG